MCGIIFAVSRHAPLRLTDSDLEILRARGPDSQQTHSVSIDLGTSIRYLSFVSTVLNLRSSTVRVQPLLDLSTGSVLCWNGEAWAFNKSQVQGNDSQFVFDQLLQAVAACDVNSFHTASRSEAVTKTLSSISGPYAVVFYDAPAATVYYARDRLGRRSLIIDQTSIENPGADTPETLTVSSFDISPTGCGLEVPTTGVHRIRLGSEHLNIDHLPWPASNLTINTSVETLELPLPNLPSNDSIQSLAFHLDRSLKLRVSEIPTYNPSTTTTNTPSRLAILFSGGIDCTLLARLSHDLIPHEQPIDLLNVAFENPRTIRAALANKPKSSLSPVLSSYELCPDRITGRSSFDELCTACPARVWRLVTIDVPYSELQSHKPTIIRLMRPHNTEMDMSIATALYFAAKGKGTAHTSTSSQDETYTTTARVLLSGLGADELFGGYSRHAAAFSRGSFDILNDELELDFKRIGTRNLGRDDRVMAHWSREIRYPFLDEGFVEFALSLPAFEKVGFREGRKIAKHFEEGPRASVEKVEDLDPAKMILRCLMWKLGLRRSANERKRAIQFGARTAKMEGGRTKGTDVLKLE